MKFHLPHSHDIQHALEGLSQVKRGLEKECLRFMPDGQLSQTSHPPSLGSTLTHPYITTNYSEALLEFITPTFHEHGQLLTFLTQIHQFVLQHIGEEYLWLSSMPCILKGEESIPIGQYGSSNLGKMKHIYRKGLGHRYGRLMQSIAGIHYNISFPQKFWDSIHKGPPDKRQDFISDSYFHLIRNFHRHTWLLIYLFGASPAVCSSFFPFYQNKNFSKDDPLARLGDHTFIGPYATSLRMSPLGYQNRAQDDLHISYNSLQDYVAGLTHAVKTPHPDYQKFGVKVQGEYEQLNANILQIENEFYAFIRPKRITGPGERPTKALRTRGVEYIEVRAIDLNPYSPNGIDPDQMKFIDLFLLHCFMKESPAITEQEDREIKENHRQTAMWGRKPDLRLKRGHHQGHKDAPLSQWAQELVAEMVPLAQMLDQTFEGLHFEKILADQREKILHPELTPSAQILKEMTDRGESYFQFGLRHSLIHKDYFLRLPQDPKLWQEFKNLAKLSLETQHRIEQQETQSFEDYLSHYFHED